MLRIIIGISLLVIAHTVMAQNRDSSDVIRPRNSITTSLLKPFLIANVGPEITYQRFYHPRRSWEVSAQYIYARDLRELRPFRSEGQYPYDVVDWVGGRGFQASLQHKMSFNDDITNGLYFGLAAGGRIINDRTYYEYNVSAREVRRAKVLVNQRGGFAHVVLGFQKLLAPLAMDISLNLGAIGIHAQYPDNFSIDHLSEWANYPNWIIFNPVTPFPREGFVVSPSIRLRVNVGVAI